MHTHYREPIDAPPPPSYWQERLTKGWKPLAVEWERPGTAPTLIEVPYGLKIAPGCGGLVEEPGEMEVLRIVMAVICEDRPLSAAVDTLNARGLKRRDGREWTAPAVFALMPRVVEIGPRLMAH